MRVLQRPPFCAGRSARSRTKWRMTPSVGHHVTITSDRRFTQRCPSRVRHAGACRADEFTPIEIVLVSTTYVRCALAVPGGGLTCEHLQAQYARVAPATVATCMIEWVVQGRRRTLRVAPCVSQSTDPTRGRKSSIKRKLLFRRFASSRRRIFWSIGFFA
jgi:hypothetical protein